MNALAHKAPHTSWQPAIRGAADEIAVRALNFSDSWVGNAVSPSVVAGLVGAHIPMLGGPSALEIALVGTPESCRAIAGAILMSEPSTLSEADTADAVGEIVNMFAGAVKRRMSAEGLDLEFGLPRFVVGHIASTSLIEVTPLPARFGTIEMFVLVVGRRR